VICRSAYKKKRFLKFLEEMYYTFISDDHN